MSLYLSKKVVWLCDPVTESNITAFVCPGRQCVHMGLSRKVVCICGSVQGGNVYMWVCPGRQCVPVGLSREVVCTCRSVQGGSVYMWVCPGRQCVPVGLSREVLKMVLTLEQKFLFGHSLLNTSHICPRFTDLKYCMKAIANTLYMLHNQGIVTRFILYQRCITSNMCYHVLYYTTSVSLPICLATSYTIPRVYHFQYVLPRIILYQGCITPYMCCHVL